jgi:hypothetical protein
MHNLYIEWLAHRSISSLGPRLSCLDLTKLAESTAMNSVLALDANFDKKNPDTLRLQNGGLPDRSDGTCTRGENQSGHFSLLREDRFDGTRVPVVDAEFERVVEADSTRRSNLIVDEG